MAAVGGEKTLHKIAAAFEPLADVVTSGAAMEVGPFAHACGQVSVLFGFLDIFFQIASQDYVSKVNGLIEASKSISTLNNMIELDIQNKRVRKQSNTRNLLRVIRVIDLTRVLFEEFIKSGDVQLRDAVAVAYEKVLAPHHAPDIWEMAKQCISTLPSRSEILERLNEDEGSVKIVAQSFIRSSGLVIQYVEELFNSRQLGIDW